MSKQYGLIIPGKQDKASAQPAAKREVTKPSIFDENSSSDDDDPNRPQLKPRNSLVSQGPSLMERRMARSMQAKALKEDPTVFQYDELYDEMEQQREQQQEVKSNEPKKPKYIGRLMQYAERRKLENELRIERQVQKEREEEGETFKDKEAFVTATYRKKLEEMRKLQEEEKRDEYLEAIGDVTKQNDLDGFYRHLFEQKMGTAKEVQKPELLKVTADNDEEVAYKPIKSGKPQQRAYRKRRISGEEEEGEEATASDQKKIHLQNNIDADSDFSIDSSSDGSEDESDEKDNKKGKKKEDKEEKKPSVIALNLDTLGKEDNEVTNGEEEKANEGVKKEKDEESVKSKDEEQVEAKPKRDKAEIWKKRTVGDVFDAAVQRYFERRAARSA